MIILHQFRSRYLLRGSAVEGIPFEVTFAATGTFPSGGSIEVSPTITETGATTGYYGSHTPQKVTLSAGNTSDTITITLPDNADTDAHGELTISIVRGDGYEVHATNHTKLVKLLDDESLPEVSVTAVGPAIDEGQDAKFELTATGTLTNSLDVEVSVDDGTSDFLTTTYSKKTETIPTAGSVVVNYSTIADIEVETNGTITVAVLADDSDIIEYLVADLGGSANLSVIDNDDNSLPSITIAADQTSINEGDVASFTLTSAQTLTPPDSVLVEISETNSGTGDFLAGDSNLYTPDRIRIDASTRTGKIELPTVPDAVVEDDGTITARIKTDSLDTKTYSVGTNHSASISVKDDDSATLPTVNIVANQRDITEGESNAVFTINSTGGTTGATLAVDVKVAQVGNFLNVAAGVRPESITIGTPFTFTEVIHDDEVDENSGKIIATLQLKNPQTYAIGENLQAEINVSDDEGSPEISIAPESVFIEEGTDNNSANYKTYAFNVRLNRESTSDITVDFTIGAVGDTAKEGASEDYTHSYDTVAKRRLTFAGARNGQAGETSKTIEVTIIGDSYNEANEQFTVTLSNLSNNALFVGGETEDSIQATGQINNDDAVPTIYFRSTTSEADEGSMIHFPVTLSAPSGRDITVSYTLTDGSATLADNDFINPVEADRTLKISALSEDGTISINTRQDDSDEADESFTITLDDPADTSIVTLGSPKTATGTILSDDDPTLSIESKSVNENVNSVTLKVRLANPSGTAISVPWNTVNGSAFAGSDYSENSGTLEFNGTNADKVKNIIIFITNDNRDEDNQSFSVQLSDVNNVIELGGGTGTITILDDDAPPTVNISSISPQTEDNDSNNPATDTVYSIDVTLSHASEKGVSVGFSVTANTAVATHDYVLVNNSNTLAFENESTSEQITFNLKADNIDEDDETFTVQLTSATNAQFATNANSPKTITITDNDAPPVFSISSVDVTEGVETGGTFIITQTPVSGKTVSLTVTYADVSAEEGTNKDYMITLGGFTANSRTINFLKTDTPAESATFSIPFTIQDDSSDETTETFTMTLSNPNPTSNATIDPNNNVGTGTIYDNDTDPKLTITADSLEIDESMNANFTITANVIPPSGFIYRYEVSQEGDFLASTANTTNPQTDSRIFTGSRASYTLPLSIDIEDDSEGESTGSVKVTLLAAATDGSTGSYTLGSDFEAEVSVFDNDLPELSIAGVAGPVIEGSGGKAQFTITSSYNIRTISLRYRPSDTGGNYLVGNIEDTDQEIDLDFNNTKTATLELDIADDDIVEEDGTIQVQLLDDVFVPEVPASTILGTPRMPAKPIQYTVIDDDTKNFGSVTVQDDDTLPNNPIITLESEYLPTGATTATYYVVANIAPAKDLAVTLEYNYKATDPENAGSSINLFTNWFRTTATISANQTYESFSQNVNFTAPYRIATPPFLIPLTGTLTVRLVDGDNYDLGNPSSSDLPTASTADNPLISISVIGESRVVESDELKFAVTAQPAPDHQDNSPISVTIHVTQIGNFIGEPLTNNMLVKTVSVPTTGINKGRAEFSVELDDDEVAEGSNGSITTTIQDGTGFVLGNYTKTATATIYDDDALPVVTIANTGSVAEDAGPVTFTLTAGVTQNTDLDVMYTAQNEVGDYLGVQTPIVEPLQFRERSGAYVADIAVQLDDDQVDEADGSVSVILLTDTTYPFTFKVGAANKGIATITDNDVPSATVPKITLASPNYIKEGASFDLVATASHPPTNLTTVNVELSSDANNNFLASGSRGAKTIEIRPNQRSGMISITTQADGTIGNRGLITAELASGAGYFTSGVASENMTSVVVLETLPVVSVSVTNSQVKENIGTFELTLEIESFTPVPNRPVKISGLTASDTGTPADYLGSIDLTSIAIDSTPQNGKYQKVIDVPVTHNTEYRGWGEITFILRDGEEYTANTDSNKRIVRVTIEEFEKSPRKISVSAPDRVIEGDDFEVTVTTSQPLGSGDSIDVEFDVVANPIGFYDSAGSDTSPITMTNARNSEKFTISTNDSTTLNSNGTIDISVIRGNQYEPATTTAESVTIVAKETLPTVSFTQTNPSSIDEGEDAVFTVTATGVTLTQELEVAVNVEEGETDNFIDSAVTKPTSVMVKTSGSGKLYVKTKADTVDEPNGTITVTIEKSSGATYLLGSPITDSITVKDNDDDGTLPELIITGSTPIFEGDVAEFTLEADPAPTGGATITARVKVTETGDFLATSAKNSPRVLDVVIRSTGGKLRLPTTPDIEDEPDAKVTGRIISEDTSDGSAPTYTIGEVPFFEITVKDNDDPALHQINIVAVASSVEEDGGVAAQFRLTATVDLLVIPTRLLLIWLSRK